MAWCRELIIIRGLLSNLGIWGWPILLWNSKKSTQNALASAVLELWQWIFQGQTPLSFSYIRQLIWYTCIFFFFKVIVESWCIYFLLIWFNKTFFSQLLRLKCNSAWWSWSIFSKFILVPMLWTNLVLFAPIAAHAVPFFIYIFIYFILTDYIFKKI